MLWTLARATLPDDERHALAKRIADAAENDEQGGDAESLLTLLAGHGLVPLAYRHLIASGSLDLPEPFAAALTAEFRRHASSRFRFARRLRDLLTVLESSGVEAVPYKGPALAVQLYGNYAMRQYGDLDILVRPAHADQALRALLAAGLVRRQPSSAAWDAYLRHTRHAYSLIDPGSGLLVELHWAITDRFHGVDLDVDWLMTEMENVDLLGRPTKAMGGERLLLALCVHGVRHLWERAVWLSEVAELIRARPRLNWAEIFERADRCDFGRALRASLILARDLLGTGPPFPWSQGLDADPDVRRLAAAFSARLASAERPPDRLMDRFRLGYLARTTLRRRLTFCWRVATHLSERDLAKLSRPPRFIAWHALQRSLRLRRKARTERRVARP